MAFNLNYQLYFCDWSSWLGSIKSPESSHRIVRILRHMARFTTAPPLGYIHHGPRLNAAKCTRLVTPALSSIDAQRETHVQKHPGHTTAEMTRRYQRRRDRFRVDL